MSEPQADDAAVYEVLHDLAHRQLRRSGGVTLNTTALVHEAWMKLARGAGDFASRGHFLAVAAMAMRQVIVDYGRKRRAQRRGGGNAVLAESALSRVGVDANIEALLAIDAALDKLAALDERLARVVELRLFAGLEEDEIAGVLAVHVRTVRRDWRKARAFLLSEMVETG